MKKTTLIFLIAAIVLFTTGLWFINSLDSFKTSAIFPFVIIFIVIGFAVFIGIRRLSSIKRGEPSEDEFSKKIMIKASSLSYYFSIYLWLLLMYLSDKIELENQTLIGIGILGMSLIFVLAWVFVKIRGFKND